MPVSASPQAGHISRKPAAFGPEIYVATALNAEQSAFVSILRQAALISQALRQSPRHYPVPTGSDAARNAPAQ